ncbi:MAG: hypothetical protein Q7J07_06210 [Pelolinea sp.]|nr:hypothetical protein [Pelolinea sp.]
MRTSLSIVFIIWFAVLTVGCGGKQSPMPEDFGLSFNWNTGTLPPQYRYEYVITIGPGMQGELDFIPGYEGAQDSERWVTPFEISREELENLYAFIADNDLLRARWNTGRELIGGSTTSLIFTAFGKEYQVPSISELEGKDKQLVESAMDAIRGVVPEMIWEEMNDRQVQYENSFKD